MHKFIMNNFFKFKILFILINKIKNINDKGLWKYFWSSFSDDF
jgi:hypothetical protein